MKFLKCDLCRPDRSMPTHLQVSWTRQRALCLRPTTMARGRRSRRSCPVAWGVSAAGVSAGPAPPLNLARYTLHVTCMSAATDCCALTSACKAGDCSSDSCHDL